MLTYRRAFVYFSLFRGLSCRLSCRFLKFHNSIRLTIEIMRRILIKRKKTFGGKMAKVTSAFVPILPEIFLQAYREEDLSKNHSVPLARVGAKFMPESQAAPPPPYGYPGVIPPQAGPPPQGGAAGAAAPAAASAGGGAANTAPAAALVGNLKEMSSFV